MHYAPKYWSMHNSTSRIVCRWWWICRVQLIACYPVNIVFHVSHNSGIREVYFKVRSRNLTDTFGDTNLIAFRMSAEKYFWQPVYYTHSYALYFVTYDFLCSCNTSVYNFWICVIHNFANGAYITGNKCGEDEMGRARSAQWGEEKFIQKFQSWNLKGTDHLGDLGVDGIQHWRAYFTYRVGAWGLVSCGSA